jgi:hypothetical protein
MKYFLFLVIKDKPKHPPNLGQVNNNNSALGYRDFLKSLKNLFKNRNFILILISYGKVKNIFT